MRTAQFLTLAGLAALSLSLTACYDPSQTEVAAWEALAVEALELSAEDEAQVPKTQIYEPWADARYLPSPEETRPLGNTIGQEIAQNGVNTAPSFQPDRFTREISRAAWDLALKGYAYDYPEAAPVAPVSPASVGQYGGDQQALVLTGVPVAQLQALEAHAAADQRHRPDCLRILGRSIVNYCSIDTMAQACFGRTCQYFDIPAGQGVELNAGFDSLVGQRHLRHGNQPIRAPRASYASGSFFIPLAVALPAATPRPTLQPVVKAAPATPAPAAPVAPAAAPATTPTPITDLTAPSISPEEAEAWDKEPLFAPAN